MKHKSREEIYISNLLMIDAEHTDSDNSSAGRAEDCRVPRLSFGRWFNSSLSEFFYNYIIKNILLLKIKL